MVTSWLWEKEQSHRLFNFHEGYRVFEDSSSGKTTTEVELIGCNVIHKNGSNDIVFKSASDFGLRRQLSHKTDRDEDKLVNVMYHDHKYYLFEPRNEDENQDNIIDNHIWLIMKFMPKKQHEVGLGDTVRFGRIPFKISKLVLDVQRECEIEKREKEEISKVMSISRIEDHVPDSGRLPSQTNKLSEDPIHLHNLQ
mmetsp:Transcript_33673/g.52003  ORF Transcript_33673/g.52003 Transcript_33673/m.52003 type:complete len:196 (+) Transcript_33673:833-1420(+)